MKEAVQGSCARHVEQQQEGSASPSRSNLSDMCPVYTPNTPTPPPKKTPFSTRYYMQVVMIQQFINYTY
jgi:hypothetical protein